MPTLPSRRPAPSIVALLAAIACAASANAQAPAERSPWTFGASGGAAWFGDADLDGGGSVQLTPYVLSLSAAYSPSPLWSAGVSLTYAGYDFTFSGRGTLASLDPWSTVALATLSLPLRYAFDRQWSVSVIPSYQIARASGASRSDADVYGGIVALSYVHAPRQIIGLGVSYFYGLDDTRVFPVPIVDWQFDDDWRLTNPLPAGPTGPAGLELVRRLDGGWEAGVGGAYRSVRFRLPDSLAAAPGGVGSYSGFIGFARLAYRAHPQWSISLFLGGDVGGKVEVDGSNGRRLYSEDVDPSPMVGFAVSGRF
jgi:hypothetical protein